MNQTDDYAALAVLVDDALVQARCHTRGFRIRVHLVGPGLVPSEVFVSRA